MSLKSPKSTIALNSVIQPGNVIFACITSRNLLQPNLLRNGAKLLSPDGTVVPSQVKPPKPRRLTNVCDFESPRNSWRRRRRKIPDDSTWYKIVKKEKFTCPNCHMDYEISRTELKRNRTVSDILKRMIENEGFDL